MCLLEVKNYAVCLINEEKGLLRISSPITRYLSEAKKINVMYKLQDQLSHAAKYENVIKLADSKNDYIAELFA